MMTTQRTKYDREFKQKLVELAQARGNAKQIDNQKHEQEG
jgi:transposase-like protein